MYISSFDFEQAMFFFLFHTNVITFKYRYLSRNGRLQLTYKQLAAIIKFFSLIFKWKNFHEMKNNNQEDVYIIDSTGVMATVE